MRVLIFLMVLLTGSCCFSQEYSIAKMPSNLTENADAVKRFEEFHVQIKSIKHAVIKHKWAITILNQAGDEYAFYKSQYSKLYSLSDIGGKLFDQNGVQIKKIRKKEIGDVTGSGEHDLITDSRIKYFSFHCNKYPYTVEFEDELSLDGIFFLPTWMPMSGVENFSVEQSKFIVETPVDYQLRYKQKNYPNKPLIEQQNGVITYTWEVQHQLPLSKELFRPNADELLTTVSIAPTLFSFGGYSGDMSTWEGFGKFILALNENRHILPPSIQQQVHQLTDHLTTTAEKVAVLYQYLQQNTRYISIQIGIGGWQPLEAKFVAEKKFGDCKALSNFMVSLLKEAGIKAHYVLIPAGDTYRPINEDFPASSFNHVIACVPTNKDTIWLECTSQTVSPGFLGSFTGNRKALMITDNGGKIVTTPQYSAEENTLQRTIIATIDEEGTLAANVTTNYTGLEQEEAHHQFKYSSKEEQIAHYNRAYDIGTYQIEQIDFKETRAVVPKMEESFTLKAANFGSITGKRMFVQPNFLSKTARLPERKHRLSDIVYPYSYVHTDSIIIHLPKNYTLESMPKNIKISNQFGQFYVSYLFNDNSIKLIRTYKRNEGRFPASDYEAFAKFYEQMNRGDLDKLVLVK